MWFKLNDGTTAVSVAQQQFSGDDSGHFEAPDHLRTDIVASGGAIAVGPHHPDHPPAAEPTIIEGPEVVDVGAALGTGPVNLPGAPVDIPEGWEDLHHMSRIALAKQLAPGQDIETAVAADQVIADEVAKRAEPEPPEAA